MNQLLSNAFASLFRSHNNVHEICVFMWNKAIKWGCTLLLNKSESPYLMIFFCNQYIIFIAFNNCFYKTILLICGSAIFRL